MDQARIEKVNKLLQKAERAGSEHEAEAFYAKAQDLMARWAIDEAMLMASGESKDEVTREHMNIKRSGYFHSMVTLATVVAQANGVRVLVYSQKFGDYAGVDFIGWKSDIERVQMLYASLLIQCSRERGRQLPEEYRNAGGKYIARWRLSFSESYAIRAGQRLAEQVRRTRKTAVDEDESGSLLPAVQDRDERVEAFFDNIPKKTSKARSRQYDLNGWESGHRAANQADIGNTRVGNGPQQSLR